MGAELRLYPVSARQALAARLQHDDAGVEASGLTALETDLAAFLSLERGQTFLVSVLDRALRLLDGALPASGAAHPPAAGSAGSPALQQQMIALRDRLLAGELAPEDATAGISWQFQSIASPQGLSAGLGPLIETVLAGLYRINALPHEESASHVEALLSAPEGCAACRISEEAKRTALAQFLAEIETGEGRRRYERSAGLCLPHLRVALAAHPPQETASYLLRQQARRLEEISEDMHSYVLKRAALRRGLTNSDEEGAWRRALVQLVGERNAGK